jgi:hypothetical protein
MILMTSSYIAESEPRMMEYARCLEKNALNPHFSIIELFVDDPLRDWMDAIYSNNRESLQVIDKVLNTGRVLIRDNQGKRMKYHDCFGLANAEHNGQIVVVANSDIWMDDTIGLAEKTDLSGLFLALTRNGGKEFESPCTAQDAWVFCSPIREFPSDWNLGIPGCDNRLVHEAKQAGYTVLNPSLSIFLHHEHASGVWTRTRVTQKVPGPYEYVAPSSLPATFPHLPHPGCCVGRS